MGMTLLYIIFLYAQKKLESAKYVTLGAYDSHLLSVFIGLSFLCSPYSSLVRFSIKMYSIITPTTIISHPPSLPQRSAVAKLRVAGPVVQSQNPPLTAMLFMAIDIRHHTLETLDSEFCMYLS